jgi:hypothetical protein
LITEDLNRSKRNETEPLKIIANRKETCYLGNSFILSSSRIYLMQKGHTLQFKCLSCSSPITFSVFELDAQTPICCHECEKKYAFTDATLVRQLKKFEALCRQIQDSEEILGAASVGVDVGEHHVKVPYKLLLTRLSSSLDLNMAGQKISIFFRIEPVRDLPVASLKTL